MKQFFVLLLLLAATSYSLAQTNVIRGKLTDETGETLPGVSVLIRNAGNGTVTDVDGNYQLEAPADAVLDFSSIGFKSKEISVNGRTLIDVVLQSESVAVDEVVITALGISQSKKALGYATQNMNQEQLSTVNTANLGSQLNGQAAGLSVSNPTGIF